MTYRPPVFELPSGRRAVVLSNAAPAVGAPTHNNRTESDEKTAPQALNKLFHTFLPARFSRASFWTLSGSSFNFSKQSPCRKLIIVILTDFF
jgi:hypothetical protein